MAIPWSALPPDVAAKIRAGRLGKLPRAKGRKARREPGTMNGTERRYSEMLDEQLAAGKILAWWFEPLKLRLAPKTYYDVDFLVMLSDSTLAIIEIKGTFIEDDAAVKFKTAREMFPMFGFRCFSGRKKKGAWTWTEKFTDGADK